MHVLTVGIEHLFTGLELRGAKDGQIFRFTRSTPSMVAIASDTPFMGYWKVKGAMLQSTDMGDTFPREEYSQGEVEYHAQVTADYMGKTERRNIPLCDPPLPYAAVKALWRKFGAADLPDVRYDGLNKCWYFTHAGMFHGIEPDGHIHT